MLKCFILPRNTGSLAIEIAAWLFTDNCGIFLFHLQACHRFSNPKNLIQQQQLHIRFYYGLGYDFLILGTPWKNPRIKVKTIPYSSFYIIIRSNPIAFRIAMKNEFFNLLEPYSKINHALNISKNSFCYFEMNFTSTIHIPSQQTNCVHNAWLGWN